MDDEPARSRVWQRFLLLVVLLLPLAAGAAPGEAERCVPWPGEPTPLPASTPQTPAEHAGRIYA